MKRGDIVTVSAQGEFGQPRPAVVIQSDWLTANDSVLVCLVTSTLIDAPLYRLTIEPSETNGLRRSSQIMIDKIIAMPRAKCGNVIGRLDAQGLISLNHMLSIVTGIAD